MASFDPTEEPFVIMIGDVTVKLYMRQEIIVHRWPDGVELHAWPRYDEPTRSFDSHICHELGHHILALHEGYDWSPTLRQVASGEGDMTTEQMLQEERCVAALMLGFQMGGM